MILNLVIKSKNNYYNKNDSGVLEQKVRFKSGRMLMRHWAKPMKIAWVVRYWKSTNNYTIIKYYLNDVWTIYDLEFLKRNA